jgi:cytochrome c oxidase cbb3-type subunit II
MTKHKHNFFYNIEKSFLITLIGILLLFSTSIAVILIAPNFVDPSWTQPTSSYQVQMYEVSDPNIYIGTSTKGSADLQFVQHLIKDYTLLAFQESATTRIIASPEMEKFVTKHGDPVLKLTSQLLLVREPQQDLKSAVDTLQKELRAAWEKEHPTWKEEYLLMPDFEILELYDPSLKEAFSVAAPDVTLENWVDKGQYIILDQSTKHDYHKDSGTIYVRNPRQYRISRYKFGPEEGWRYDPNGQPLQDLQQLKGHELGFRSKQELIHMGEEIYKIEGCWYCHTDQTRTLVQDVVLNGSDSYPAPPSTANEFIYQYTTFPGTRRIGPDISRVGVKRPSRDWHKGHFWSPKTASRGSIMPQMRHFFDNDPRGTSKSVVGIPNYKFEAMYQYLMTKGTRITPPTQAWWLGKDPIKTKEIIEGERKLP